jgi:hypothetical protein
MVDTRKNRESNRPLTIQIAWLIQQIVFKILIFILQGQEIFSSPKPFRLALGPNQPPIQSLLWLFKGCEAVGVLTTHLHLVPRLRMDAAVCKIPYMSS